MPAEPQTRATAARIIATLLTNKDNLTHLLPEYLCQFSRQEDRAFIQNLCFGVMRWYFSLEFILENLLGKKIRTKDQDIRALALIGLYQFIHLRVPEHAAISATVDACVDLNKPWAKNLLNAILRRYQREQEIWNNKTNEQAETKYAHPAWMIQRYQKEYPQNWESICIENNCHPPMYLRVNINRISRENYRELLFKHDIESEITRFSNSGLRLVHPVDVVRLPRFQDGFVSVQDLAAQLCTELLALRDNMTILDACAAPGGKLAHLLESGRHFQKVVAIEQNGERYSRLVDTLTRLGLNADLLQENACNTDHWWDGVLFDRILLDVPCSASGVIRRHPDIKFLRTPEEITTITAIQRELLSSMWALLNRGGRLLYVTCSVFNAENDDQIKYIVENEDNIKPVDISADWGTATKYGRQVLPGQDDMDGFYYACLEKT